MNKSYKDIVHKQIDYFIFEIAKTYGLNRNDVVEEFKQYINQFKDKNASEVKLEALTMEQRDETLMIKKLCCNCLLDDDEDIEFCEECHKRSDWTPSTELVTEVLKRCKVGDSCNMDCRFEISNQNMTCASLANLVFEV